MTRMRISLVTLGDPATPTGGYLYHRRLAEAAPRHDAEVSFVSFPDLPFPLPRVARRRVLGRAADADVVVVDSIAAAFVGGGLRRYGGPVVGMLHQTPGGIDHGPLRTRLQSWLDRRAYRYMTVLLVASKSLAQEVAGFHPDARVVPPGRDVARGPDEDVLDLRRGRRVSFLCVANWIARKGITDLLDAFTRLPERAASLHLVGDERGDPRYATKVRRRIDDLRDRVVVHGVVPKERVAAFYRDADAFVLPSYEEPYGTVYGEAMAAGLPVVGWRAGNLPNLADDQREGLIVPPGDVDALARALQQLSEDDEFRQTLGRAALHRAANLPTWEQTAEMFFRAVRAVVSTAGSQ